MVCASGTSSGSSRIRSSGSEEDLLLRIMDQRKQKRMISNRESARRSRMRKQKHLDELAGQVGQLRNQNNHILTNINVTTQLYLNIDAENSVLRAQLAELTHRLQSLSDIINCLDSKNSGLFESDDELLNPWNLVHVNQPSMASTDMLMD